MGESQRWREREKQKKEETERWWRGKGEVEKARGRGTAAVTFGGDSSAYQWSLWWLLSIDREGKAASQPGGPSVSQARRQAWGWIYTLRSRNRNLALGNRKRTIGSLRMEGKV